ADILQLPSLPTRRSSDLMLEHPEKWTEFFGSTPVYVFTSRMLPVPAGVEIRFVDGSVATALPGIREAAGDGDIWVMGGGELVGQFLDAGGARRDRRDDRARRARWWGAAAAPAARVRPDATGRGPPGRSVRARGVRGTARGVIA